MKLTVTILVGVLAAGLAWAQNPSIIQNTRNTMNAVSNHEAAASNQALGIHQSAPSVVTAERPAPPAGGHAQRQVWKKHAPAHGPRHHELVTPVVLAPASKPAEHPAAVAASGAAEGKEGESDISGQEVVPDAKYAANGRRDPFISPVVSHVGGSGCSSGKKCLDIGEINLKGVVHSDNGFIAVVSNGLNKAYFLRENDPVFNGYVMKITGDSIVFQETLQDRLGKSFTREVVKKITTPAV